MDTIKLKCKKCGREHFAYEDHQCNMNEMMGYMRAKREAFEILARMVIGGLIDADLYDLVKAEMGEIDDEEGQL